MPATREGNISGEYSFSPDKPTYVRAMCFAVSITNETVGPVMGTPRMIPRHRTRTAKSCRQMNRPVSNTRDCPGVVDSGLTPL